MFIAAKAHAELGASSSGRWMNCPGSVPLSRPYANRTSFYAAEGSVAHSLAEMMLKNGDDASRLAGTIIEHDGHQITVTDEMEDGVQTFLEEVMPVIDGAEWFGFEQRVSIHSAPEGAELFGTLDAGAITGVTLFIGDFKFGKGVPVGVNWNTQLLFYALALYETLFDEDPAIVKDVKKILMVVCQPRLEGGSEPKRWEIDLIDLLMWRDEELLPAVQRIMDGDETLEAGKWCRFCPAIGACPLKYQNAVEAAKMQFDDMTGSNSGMISSTELGNRLALARSVVEWAKYLEKEVVRLIRQGEEVEGWKIVEGRSNRGWAGESPEVMREIIRRSNCGEQAQELVKAPELKSPAQVEKVLKRWKKKPEFILDGLVFKPPGKPKLAEATDSRPAIDVARAGADFDEWADFDEEP